MGAGLFGINQSALNRWAGSREAQSEFPRLIRRLILETTPGLLEIDMPAGDGVAAAGWDGVVVSPTWTPWVPEGTSVWELSVNSRPNIKADDDYSKRTEVSEGLSPKDSTYVEVILRRWTDRRKWAAEKRKDGHWKDVKAFGLDDIETWLESAPATSIWLAELIGVPPHGYRSGEAWWNDWSAQTKPPLTADMILAGRSETMNELALEGELARSITTIAGQSGDEVCAFIAAVALKLDEQGHSDVLSKLVFVDDLAAWRQLQSQPLPLILVPRESSLNLEVSPSSNHRVLLPAIFRERADLVIPQLDSKVLAEHLENAGLEKRMTAEKLGHLGRRSLTALRRHLATNPGADRPSWASSKRPRLVRGLLLGGAWSDATSADRLIVESLVGSDYESIRDDIASTISDPQDPFMMLTDGTWHLVSAVDAWILLGASITVEDLNRFKEAVLTVLAEKDPSLELPIAQRWESGILGKTRRFSRDLRAGLARSLALLGTEGGVIELHGGATGSVYANSLVRQLLQVVSDDETGNGWKSISDILPYLAEAGPDAFLDAVELGLSGEHPILASIFEDDTSDSGNLFSGSAHTGLLCALECVSWDREYFARTVELLAMLDEIDQGGRYANRPAESLASIFCTWYPNSSIEIEKRIDVLDILRNKYPTTAWNLQSSMLPGKRTSQFEIYRPSYRTWKTDISAVTRQEYGFISEEVVKRCTEDAGTSAERWEVILNQYPCLSHTDRQLVLGALDSTLASTESSSEFQDDVWHRLEEILGKHREYVGAGWALSQDEIDWLSKFAERYRPRPSRARWKGLFSSWRPYLDKSFTDDLDAYHAELDRCRAEVVKEVEIEEGIAGLLELVRTAQVNGAVGKAIAQSELRYDDELLQWLVDSDKRLVVNAKSYFSTNYHRKGFEYIKRLVSQTTLSSIQKARLLLEARDDLDEAWQLASQRADINSYYWNEFSIYSGNQNLDRIDEVCLNLVKVERYVDALSFISFYIHLGKNAYGEGLAESALEALDLLLRKGSQSSESSLDSHDLQGIFGFLENNRDCISHQELIRLEWAYLPALGYEANTPALFQLMSQEPEAFVKVITMAYRPCTESSDEDRAKVETDTDTTHTRLATNAHRLLHTWNLPPGLIDGVMDPEALNHWMDKALPLLSESSRTSVGLQEFGKALFHSPPDSDGTWPSRVIRQMLEKRKLDHVETGLYLALLNSRGVTSRSLDEGGEQERKLAEKYRSTAKYFSIESPRVARIFRDLANSYESEARREDADAERHRRGVL